MFIITDETMSKTDYQFDPIEDIQILTSLSNIYVVRTEKLLPTLFFMQKLGWKLWELQADDRVNEFGELIEWEILTYYKPKWQN